MNGPIVSLGTVGDVHGRVAAVSVAEDSTWLSLGRAYYGAYERYLSCAVGSAGCGSGCGRGVSSMEGGVPGIVPPVWVGRSGTVASLLSSVGDVGKGAVESAAAAEGCFRTSDCESTECGSGSVEDAGVAECGGDGVRLSDELSVVDARGKHYEKNKKKRLAAKLARLSAKRKGNGDGCGAPGEGGTGMPSVVGTCTGSVRTVDTRTGVEIEAVQTLAARRVAENKRAEVEAKVAAALAEHKLRALSDKGRTAVVERLAAARYEQRINEARLRAQKSFSASEDSLKSLGSMGSAGELYAKQAIKKSRDDAKTLKYVQDQASLLLEHASPEVRQMVAEMPPPVYDDEFEVFGDCPSDFDEEQREAYYADLNRANFELGQVRVESEGHREATPEELLRIKEELAALSVY